MSEVRLFASHPDHKKFAFMQSLRSALVSVGYERIKDIPQWGFPMDGAFPRGRCAYCGSMTDMRGNCGACGAPK